jgi:hypothetical protein
LLECISKSQRQAKEQVDRRRVFTNLIESMNVQFKSKFQITANSSFDEIVRAMIDYFDQQSVNTYTGYTNFSREKPLSTTVTEESRNFGLDLQNYSRHAQELIRYHGNPFQLKSIQLSFSVFHLASIDKSESEHLENLAKELIYRKAVHIIDANDAKCQLAH